MYYCLNKTELKEFIDHKARGRTINDDSLRIRIEDAEWWGGKLGGLTYLLSQILDRYSRADGHDCARLITMLYGLEDSMDFSLHECDAEFVKFMLKNVRDRDIDLEDELVELQSHLGRYEYGTTIRFGH